MGVALTVLLGTLGASLSAPVAPTGVAGAVTLQVPTITTPSSSFTSFTPTVAFSGTATAATEATVAIVITATGHWVAQAALAEGAWSLPVTLPVKRGETASTYHVSALEIDKQGDIGTASSPVAVTVATNDLVQNGGFESPQIAPAADEFFSKGTFPGWETTTGHDIEIQTKQNRTVTPYTGTQYAELASNGVTGVVQGLATVPGLQYTLSFAYRGRGPTVPASTNAQNVMSVSWGGTTVAGSLQGTKTRWQVATYVLTATSTTTTLAFHDAYQGTSTTGDFLDGVSVVPTFTLAPSNTRWQTAATLASSASGTISFSGEQLWYKVPVTPSEHLDASLTNVDANYQVSLYSDITSLYKALTTPASPPTLTKLAAQNPSSTDQSAQFYDGQFYDGQFYDGQFYDGQFYDGQFYDGQFYDGQFYDGQFYDGQFYDGQFYDGQFYDGHGFTVTDSEVLPLSEVGVSTQQGSTTKTVSTNTFNNTGYYYVEVSGVAGAFSSSPFTLSVSASGNACSGAPVTTYFQADGYTTTTGSGTVGGTGSSTHYKTVIVEDSRTMPDVSTISASLQALAAKTTGIVVDVGKSKWVTTQTTQAQAYAQCPYDVNLEAGAIQHVVNTYRFATSTSHQTDLQYVVIVGDDDVIPFFRDPDQEQIQPESNYVVPLSGSSQPQAALANDFFLTDDQYGSTSSITVDGSTLPIQSAAVGRLVETPTDIQRTIQSYLANDTVTARTSLTAGYTFMAPPAKAIARTFTSEGLSNSSLITNERATPTNVGTPATTPTLSWTAGRLTAKLSSSAHQLVFIGAHFNANALLSADRTSYLTTTRFASKIGTELQGSLVLSAGCHAGYTIDPKDATQYTDTLAWPQALTEAGATLIAGTGYQYGDSNYVTASDQVYADLAQQLGYAGSNGGAIGTSLLHTQWRYLAGLDKLNGIEQKSLLETTLYGLPMLKLHVQSSLSPSTGGADIVSSTTKASTEPGQALGLQWATVTVPASIHTTTVTGASTTYPSGPQGSVADPGAAILPVQVENVKVAGQTLRGVGFWGGAYTDSQPGKPPLTGDPVTQTAGTPVPFSSPTYYPQRIWNPNYFATLDTAAAGNELGVTPMQFVTTPATPSKAITRTFSTAQFRLFYSANTATYGKNIPALAAPPNISEVSVDATQTTPTRVTVSATVAGDPTAGVQQVWTTWTNPTASSPKWTSVTLAPSSSTPGVWSATFFVQGAAQSDFVVQAANGVGEVSFSDDNGAYYRATTAGTTPVTPAATTLTLTPTSSSGTFGATATLHATLTSTSAALAARPVTFSIGPVSTVAYTDGSGTATASIPLTTLAPASYDASASFAGDGADAPASASGSFSVVAALTSITLTGPSSKTFRSGQPSAFSATVTSGGRPVVQQPVYFVVRAPTSAVVGGSVATTNAYGIAEAGNLSLPAGDTGPGYEVTAYFSTPATPAPGGTPIDAAVPGYDAAVSASLTVGVLGRTQATQTTLSASPDPATFGQPVTLSATVDPSGAFSAWPSATVAPTGTVTFSEGSTVVGTGALHFVNGEDTATTTVTGLGGGTHSFEATYPGGTGYLTSSGSATDVVGFTKTVSGDHFGPLVVARTQVVLLTGTVRGPVTVKPGGGLEVRGGSVQGPIRAFGASAFALCGATVSGPVSVIGSKGFVFIGGGATTGCAETTITGSVSLAGNVAGLEVADSTVSGPMIVLFNVGRAPAQAGGAGPVIAGNTIEGPLSCWGNNPTPTDAGQPNDVAGPRGGQCDSPKDF